MTSVPRVPILMLHKVSACPKGTRVPGHYVSPGLFRRQVRTLRLLGFQSTGLNGLFDGPLPKRPIVFTFDDGYEDFYTNAMPILKEAGYTATAFLVANLIGKINAWDADRGDVTERLMSYEQIREAQKAGMQFGSHTLDHADLSAVPKDEAWQQIHGSKVALDRILCENTKSFCYPYGRKTAETEEMVARAGFRIACSTVGGVNTSGTNRYALRRINVRGDTTPAVLIFKLLRDFRRG